MDINDTLKQIDRPLTDFLNEQSTSYLANCQSYTEKYLSDSKRVSKINLELEQQALLKNLKETKAPDHRHQNEET